jgi:hypothetical protein
MAKKPGQPHFRVVDLSGVEREPRRTCQGTSSRSDSQTTAPLVKNSNLIARSSPHFLPQQKTLERCPTDVPQLSAKSRFSAADSPVQYSRGVIVESHHMVGQKSTPASGHTIWCNGRMPTREERSDIRRENLKRYCVKYLGGPHTDRAVMKALKKKTGHSGSSYVNDLLAEGSTKGIAEEAVHCFLTRSRWTMPRTDSMK